MGSLRHVRPTSRAALLLGALLLVPCRADADGTRELIAARKRDNAARRADLMGFFDRQGFRYTPSVSNKLMVDARMPTQQVIDGMREKGVWVGRPWPVWPTHVRVSLGSQADLERFKVAFVEVAGKRG